MRNMIGWFSDLFSSAAEKVRRERTEDFLFVPLGQDQGSEIERRPLRTDLEYVSVRVKSARIVNVREWGTRFYGCVHGRVAWLDEAVGAVDYQTILSPPMLRDQDPSNLADVIQIDKPLVGPVPYRGQLEIELGLFSIKAEDLVGPYIDLLTSIADQSGVAFFSRAVPFVEPLRKGAELLFSSQQRAQLEIGLDRGWANPETGMYAVIRAPKETFSTRDLHIDLSDYRLTGGDGQPVNEYPYFVVSVEASDERTDWMKIPDVAGGYAAVRMAIQQKRLSDVDALVKHFEMICIASPDLVTRDGARIAKKWREKLKHLNIETTLSAPPSKRSSEHQYDPLGPIESLSPYV